MAKAHPIIHVAAISFLALIISLGITFLALLLVQDIFNHPQRYFFDNFSSTELPIAIVFISGIIISISVSLVVFLLLSSRARIRLSVWKSTRWLAISREQFKKLYDEAPVPYLMLNDKGEIDEPNKAALRFFEAISEEIEGKNLFSFCSEDDSGRAETLFRQYKLDIPINREEMGITCKSGRKKWVLLSVFEVKNPASRKHAGLTTLLDITELKNLDAAKTEFLSIASHQLHTPLVTVKWYIDMLLSGDLGGLNEKQKDYMSRLLSVNKDMAGLVDTLLNVSRIEMGTLPIDIKPTNVQDLVDNILSEFEIDITKKGVRVNKEYNNSLEHIQSDPRLLKIVIQNLISNAIKYTTSGGKITVELLESGNKKQIMVTDTGLGIPQEEQGQIFTKLFRAGNVTALNDTPGSGLGLYLTKTVIETLGGRVHFKSKEGVGSTFIVDL